MGSSLSLIASVAILRSSINGFVPQEIRSYLLELVSSFSSELTMVVYDSHEGSINHLFNALMIYLGSNAFSTASLPKRITVGKNENIKALTFSLDRNCKIVDTFNGVDMKWAYCSEFRSELRYELKWYELRFHKRHANMVRNQYLPHILETAQKIKNQNRVVKFYTTRGGQNCSMETGWSCKGINLDHPMTFDTLAMDGNLKQKVIEDLDRFIKGKKYYKKIGKAWKRGYLLYGPPGTGKSSLIAAMANHLNFDIYSLNLSAVSSDSSLEFLLLHMSNRSILVVEDIDCSIELQNRQVGDHPSDLDPTPRRRQGKVSVTLSGFLNAIDGLLSCCGEERIIVFTTNYKDRIDPALIRAGRMDKHINLSYCTFSTFKQLAANYLDIWNHDLFPPIEKLISEVQVSPAEVAGELMKIRDPKTSLESLSRLLESKREAAKFSAPPPSVPEGLEDAPGGSSESPYQRKEHQVQSSCKTNDLADGIFSKQTKIPSSATAIDPASNGIKKSKSSLSSRTFCCGHPKAKIRGRNYKCYINCLSD